MVELMLQNAKTNTILVDALLSQMSQELEDGERRMATGDKLDDLFPSASAFMAERRDRQPGIDTVIPPENLSEAFTHLDEEWDSEPVDWEFSETAPQSGELPVDDPAPLPCPFSGYEVDDDGVKREAAMSLLLGRWSPGINRRDIRISRRGEHFILSELNRKGRPDGARYVLLWWNGEIYTYGYGDRVTLLVLDTETDTLMVSPGEDYTRVAESQM